MTRSLFAPLCLVLLLAAAASAQRDLQDIPPPDPEQERETFVLPEGFEVNLFAADPQIAKPIQMNFDPQGRLWIVSSQTYPQILPGAEADDKVLYLEDIDGDGISDKTTVFADGLLIPTGIAPGDGGAYVAASTEVLHLKDTDGDGKADSRRIVLSGFGTEDTHHIIHTFRWGPEQLLYFKQSIYIHSHVETPWGVERLNAGGTWRFRPEDYRMSVFDRGLVNSWGLDFDEYGTTFATDGAGGEGINYIVPGASYLTAYGAERILHGLNPGSPKHCGLEIVGGSHLPDDWQGSFITSDFRGHRVCRFVLTESGTGFVSQEQEEVIKSDHVAFRPIDAKMGPDGALYIADWYNPIIQHGEVDFRDPRRDHTHGRIWRVTFPDNPLVEQPDLVNASNDGLVEYLSSPEPWTRSQVKRLLKERGKDVLPAVKRWARRLDSTSPDYHRHRLEALWVYQSLDVVEPELLESLLRCLDHNARAAACRVVGDWYERLEDPLALLQFRASDEHPRVRLEAVRALARIPDPHSIEVAMRALDPEVPSLSSFMPIDERQANQREDKQVKVDEWLDYALWLTARDLQPIWQPALLAGEIDFGGNTRHLTFVLKSAGSAETVPVLTRLLRSDGVSEEDRDEVLTVITDHAGTDQLQVLVELADEQDDPTLTTSVLRHLLRAKSRRDIVPDGDLKPLDEWITSDVQSVRGSAARCIGAFRVERLWPALKDLAMDDAASIGLRTLALNGVAAYGGPEAEDLLARLANGDGDGPIRLSAIRTIVPLQPKTAAAASVEIMRQPQNVEQVGRVLEAILQNKDAIQSLESALADQMIHSDAAVVAMRTVTSSGQSLPGLSSALQRAGGVTSGPKELSPEEMQSLINEVEAHGDPAAGEKIYRRQELNCIKCHAIGGAGGLVGPDMQSLGTTAQLDYIVNSLLDPNKQIKENYHTQVVLTDEGLTLSGILVRQTDTDLLLRDAEGREQSIPLDSIEARQEGVSLMPTGLSDKLTRTELVDLVAFLKSLGRLPEYTVSKERIARTWQVLLPTDEAAYALGRNRDGHAATDDPVFQWQPVYSRVNGTLPLRELPHLRVSNRNISFVRLQLESDTAGSAATLSLNNMDGLKGWWNGEPVELSETTDLSLQEGLNRLTIAVTTEACADDLRIEINDAPADVRFAQ